jgi:hypothetical protein
METMKNKVLVLSIVLVIVAAIAGAMAWLLTAPCPPGRFAVVDSNQSAVEIPEAVREDAMSLASQFADANSAHWGTFVDSLLEVYAGASGKDCLLVFNSGGQGQEEIGPEWGTILVGIREELRGLGYDDLLVIYERTADGFLNFMKELRETGQSYHEKAKPLAAAADFFTEHIEGIKVIMLGESSGAMVSNEAMALLPANDRVYSIQTGTPFYYGGVESDRSVVINDNGIVPDSLHSLDAWTIFKANLGRIPTYRPAEGHFLFYMRTPGHIYTWEHPGVRSEVSSFLEEQFSGN